MDQRKLLILSPFQKELKYFLSRIHADYLRSWKKNKPVYQCFLNKTDVRCVITGVGPKNVRKFFKTDIIKEYQPDRIITAGFCGAVDKDMKCGHSIMITEAFNEKEREKCRAVNRNSYREGVVYQVERLYRFEDKERLRSRFPEVSMVDMESLEFLKSLNTLDIPYQIIRVVSDELNFCFPRDELVDDRLNFRLLKKLIHYGSKEPAEIFRWRSMMKRLNTAEKKISEILINETHKT